MFLFLYYSLRPAMWCFFAPAVAEYTEIATAS